MLARCDLDQRDSERPGRAHAELVRAPVHRPPCGGDAESSSKWRCRTLLIPNDQSIVGLACVEDQRRSLKWSLDGLSKHEMGDRTNLRVGAGLPGLLKDGYKHFSGMEEAVLRNIEATRQLAQITRTSLGPNGVWRGGTRDACVRGM